MAARRLFVAFGRAICGITPLLGSRPHYRGIPSSANVGNAEVGQVPTGRNPKSLLAHVSKPNRTTIAPVFDSATGTLSIWVTFLPRDWSGPKWAGSMGSATIDLLMPAGGQLAPERDVNAATPLKATSGQRRRAAIGRKIALSGFRSGASLGLKVLGQSKPKQKLHFWPDRVQVRSLHLQLGCDFGGTIPPKTDSKGLLTLKLSACK